MSDLRLPTQQKNVVSNSETVIINSSVKILKSHSDCKWQNGTANTCSSFISFLGWLFILNSGLLMLFLLAYHGGCKAALSFSSYYLPNKSVINHATVGFSGCLLLKIYHFL